MEYTYFTFPTTYFAIRAEKVVEEQLGEGRAKMVPVPRKISSSCGTALRCQPDKADDIESILQQQRVEIEGRHQIKEEERLNLKKLFGLNKG